METIGLTTKQLRKLGKAYTDKQMVKRADFDEILVTGNVWSNREIVLFEAPPAKADVKEQTATERVKTAQAIARLIDSCRAEVYPVEIMGGDGSGFDSPSVVFSDGNGTTVRADARYIAAMLKIARVGKAKDNDLRWTVGESETGLPAVMLENGHRVGLVSGLVTPPNFVPNPDWSFKYAGPLA